LYEVDKIAKGNIRYRYIAFHIIQSGNTHALKSSDFVNALRQSTRDFFHKDMKELGVRLIQLNGNTGIIKCLSQNKGQMMQLLQSLRIIGGAPIIITTSSTSGTIHGLCKKKMKSYK
jgi:RNase P/RNase MRP subunit POP5